MTDQPNITDKASKNRTGYPAYVVQIDESAHHEMFDLRELYVLCKGNIKLFSVIIGGFALAALITSFLITPIYESEASVMIKEKANNNNENAFLGQFGGLGSLAGFDSSGSDQSKTYAMLTSRDVTTKFIQQKNIKPILFAGLWSSKENKWISDDPEDHPTDLHAYGKLTKEVLKIDQNSQSGVITISIKWNNPVIASEWANGLVQVADDIIRRKDIEETNSHLEYLSEELKQMDNALLRQSILRLVENEMNQAMLASAGKEYTLQVIDPAVPPEYEIWPNLRVILALAILGGLSICSIILVAKYSRIRTNQEIGT